MDSSKMFLCTVIHPRLFPGPITDPGNPLRVKMLVEVGTEELIIRASAESAKGKIMGSESLSKIEQVIVKRIDGSAQRVEILRRSLLRMTLVGGIVLVFFLLARPYSIGISVLIALAIAVLTAALNFLLNGGLGDKQNIVRFHFKLSDYPRGFSLEVPETKQQGLHQALLAVGLTFLETGTKQ